MKNLDTLALGAVIGVILMGVILLFIIPGSEQFYADNVCTYLGGELKEDVCIVNSQVVDIKVPK